LLTAVEWLMIAVFAACSQPIAIGFTSVDRALFHRRPRSSA
jgi:hypothetical protein